MRKVRALSIALLCGLCACLDLPDVQRNLCGNGVKETGEDCDSADSATCGQPGTEHACLYVCSSGQEASAEGACPPHFRCGADGVCRTPVAEWLRAGSVPEGAESISIADFDGDGLDDVLAVASPLVRVHYFDASGSLVQTSSVSAPDANPAVGNLTASADEADRPRADFTISVNHGIDVVRGAADQTLQPVAYSSASFPIATRALRATVPNQLLGLELVLYDDAQVSFSSPLGGVTRIATLFSEGAGKLAGELVAAPLFENTLQPCDELVAAFEGASEVWVYPICAATGAINKDITGTKITLQDGYVCADCQAVHTVDVDGDKDLDLVIGGKDGKLFIALNSGNGHFQSRPTGDPALIVDAAAEFPIPDVPAVPPPHPQVVKHLRDTPLAVGDLNGDCVLDYVNDFGIYVSYVLVPGGCLPGQLKTALGYVSLSEFEGDHRWTESRIVDMNADGQLDVLVGSRDRTGITFFRGVSGALFNPFQIATSGPVKDFTLGDFDGDLQLDLAFTELGATSNTSSSLPTGTLSVLFGDRDGKPSERISMGEIAGVTQLIRTDLPLIYPDTAAEIIALSTTMAGSTDAAVFIGSGDRQLKAPYYLFRSPDKDQFDVPVQSVIGQFDGDASGHGDVAVFSSSFFCPFTDDCEAYLFLLPATGDADLVPPADEPLDAAALKEPFNSAEGVLMTAWKGAPPLDAVVMVAPGEPPSLAIVSKASGKWEASDPVALPAFALANIKEGQILAADVDGQRGEDIVLASRSGGVAVYLNNGDGSLDIDHPRLLSLDAFAEPAVLGEYCRADDEHSALGVGALSLDPGAASKALVLTTRTASYLARDDGQKLVLSCRDDIPGGSAVAAGDINGDGIDDVVIGDKGRIEVLLGKAASPGEAAAQ